MRECEPPPLTLCSSRPIATGLFCAKRFACPHHLPLPDHKAEERPAASCTAANGSLNWPGVRLWCWAGVPKQPAHRRRQSQHRKTGGGVLRPSCALQGHPHAVFTPAGMVGLAHTRWGGVAAAARGGVPNHHRTAAVSGAGSARQRGLRVWMAGCALWHLAEGVLHPSKQQDSSSCFDRPRHSRASSGRIAAAAA
jgi:hypothetical protein